MEDQSTYQEPFKEEYWAAALDTLKKEERKALYMKWAPVALAALLIASLVFVLKFNQDALGMSLKTLKSNANVEQHFAGLEINTIDQSAETSEATSKNETQITSIAKGETGEEVEVSKQGNARSEEPLADSAISAIASNELKDKEPESKSPISRSIAQNIEGEVFELDAEDEGDALRTADDEPNSESDDAMGEDEASYLDVNNDSENPFDLKETQVAAPGSNGDDSMLRNAAEPEEEASTDFAPIGINTLRTNLQYKVPALLTPRSYSAKQLRQSESRAQFHKNTYLGKSLKGYVGSALLTGYGTEKGLIDWNPSLGLMYEFKLRGPWWASAGLGYQQINGVRYQADFFADELSFGYATVRTRVATNTLYIVEVPVQLWRDFSMRSSFMLGANAEAIVNSNSGLSETKLNGDESEELSNDNSLGYVQGFNQLLFGARLGYRYRLNKRTDISLIKQFGLSEVNNGDFYLNNGNDVNNRWLLQLNFTIK